MKRLISSFLCLSVLAACSVGSDGEILDSEEISKPLRSAGALVDPVHGKEVTLWYGAIEGANGEPANGVGFIHLFEDGVSVVNASVNIAPLTAPDRYTVRVSDASGARAISIGVLESIVGDARHVAKGETEEDLSDRLLLTVYRDRGPGTQETEVARGMMKIPAAPVQ